jgi:protein gp37
MRSLVSSVKRRWRGDDSGEGDRGDRGGAPMKWWDATWNTITGCTKVSPACASCWAEERTNALSAHAAKLSRGFGEVVLHERCLDDPRKWWRSRKRIFVNNMSDTFHQAVPDAFILRHLHVVRDCSRHGFLFLTKRSERLRDFTRAHPFPANAWAGVTVESEAYLFRVDHLRAAQVPHRYLSVEPQLEPLPTLDLTGIDWVIVGGEKAANPRPMRPEWVREIRDNCRAAGVPFLLKQMGGVNRDGGHLLDGATYMEYPEAIR